MSGRFIRSRGKDSGSRRGQYMVEYALLLIFFVGMVIGMIDLILVGYDYNLAQRCAWEAARKAAIGQTNAQIQTYLNEDMVSHWISTMVLVAAPDFNESDLIVPNDLADRVEGMNTEIKLDLRIGFSLVFGQIYINLPVRSRLIVIAPNDTDRDGVNDSSDPLPNDHEYVTLPGTGGDGTTDHLPAGDDDGDGYLNWADRGQITDNGTSTTLTHFGVDGIYGTGDDFVVGADFGDRQFVAREFHRLSTNNYDTAPYPIVPREVPRYTPAFGVAQDYSVVIDLSYDYDNDGWEDKWDAAPATPGVH